MTQPPRREFLMLAKPAKGEEEIGGWFLSEKLDGMRCFWDGGVSRGFTIDEIPWANTGKNTETVATGLWSRYGNPIAAPDWFLNELPCCPLDGELFCGRGDSKRPCLPAERRSRLTQSGSTLASACSRRHRWTKCSALV